MIKFFRANFFYILIAFIIFLLFIKFFIKSDIPVPYKMDYIRFLTEQIRVIEDIKQDLYPIWNPYILCGMPTIANVMSNLFSPFLPLYFVFSDPVFTYILIMTIELFLIGLTFFIMMRKIFNINKICAYISSISFTLCGFMFWINNIPMRSIEDLLFVYPIAFLFYYKLRSNPSFIWSVLISLILALSYINCNGSVLQYGYNMVYLFLFHIFCTVLLFQGFKTEFKITFLTIFALGLSLGLCAFQFLPVYEAVNNSTRFASGELIYAPKKIFPTIISFFYPDIWPKFPFINSIGGFNGLTYGVVGYCGIPALILALIGAFYAKDKKKWFFILYPSIYLIIWPFYSAEATQKLIPSFLKTGNHFFYSFYLCSFSVAVLAGLGCEVVISNLHDIRDLIKCGKTSSIFLRISTLFLSSLYLCANIFLILFMILISYQPSFIHEKMLTFLSKTEQFARSDSFYADKIDYILEVFCSNFPLFISSGIIKLTGLILIYVLLYCNVKHKQRIFYFSLIFVVLDFVFVGYQYLSFLPRDYYYPKTDTIEYMESVPENKNTFRVGVFFEDSDWFWNKYPDASFDKFMDFSYSLSDSLHENILIKYGFQQIGGYEGLCPNRQYQYFKLLGNNRGFGTHGIFLSQINSPLLDLANMKYVISSEEITDEKFEKRFSGKRYSVYFNKSAYDRVFMVPRAKYVQSEEELFDILKNPQIDFSKEVLISGKEFTIQNTNKTDEAFSSTATIKKYTPNEVIIETECNTDAWLVLTDAYYPGWKAKVDSESAEIYPANQLFRTVFIKQGKHIIKFKYFSGYMKIGLIISSVSVLLCVSIIFQVLYSRSYRFLD